MSEYQEFTGKSVEEALKTARESFDVASLDDLDFEILTPGSRGVLGMGAEPARIIAAPRSALGGAAPRREAAASTPLPPPAPAADGDSRPRDRDRDRSPRRRDGDRRGGERARVDRPARKPASQPRETSLSESEQEEVRQSRASLAVEREEIQAVEASPEALEAGREILEQLLTHIGLQATVSVQTGDTAKLDVTAEEQDKEALGALIGRKGERLSALQHLVNLMLSRKMGAWTRVLVDVEDYRGRRERQLRDIAEKAAAHVVETGKMLQLEPMPALERRWVHLALRGNPDVATQSIGEEPQRRVVILRKG
jgi:spoIIIJ-associated protein